MRFPTFSIISQAVGVLPKEDRPKIVLVSLLQVILGFMDLLGVAIIGIMGALAVTGIQSKEPGSRVFAFLEFMGLDGVELRNQVAILAIIAALVLMTRTFFSILITRKVFFFLSHRGAAISANLTSKLLSRDLLFIQSQSTQQTLFALTSGVNTLTLGVLGNATTLLSDLSLLIIIAIGLFLVDPLIAISTILIFGGLGVLLYLRFNVKAQKLGLVHSNQTIESNQEILEVLGSFRELFVRDRRNYYSKKIAKSRHKLAVSTAEMQFLPNVSKYVIESGVVLGGMIVGGIQFLIQDAAQAVAALSVFLASGTRIAPAIMRLQHSAISLRSSAGSANSTIKMIESLAGTAPIENFGFEFDVRHSGFVGSVILNNVSFKYPLKNDFAIKDVSLQVFPGEFVAIVGPSGAGKTSLVDILLGLLKVSEGEVLISGKSTVLAIQNWPGAISYVPQEIYISNASIEENVTFGYPREVVNEKNIWEALEVAQLKEFVETLPEGLATFVGERGTRISGGQRQRLGIARALFTKPKLLVLDEASSALDGPTEAELSLAFQRVRGDVTVIMIAHRLSTVRNADKVIYMEKGQIKSVGTFEEVRVSVPNFDKQAFLMGL